MNPLDLSGKVVLLTGAGGLLGRSMSRAICAAGADLVLVGRRVDALQAQINALPVDQRGRCQALACDITQPQAPKQILDAIQKRHSRLDGLVNNAYAGTVGPLETIGAGDFMQACNYNLAAPFALVKTLLPLLERDPAQGRHSASVVNIASMYGSVSPDPTIYADSGKNNPVHYGATKAGMIQMTRYLACHLGGRGVRVNSISPGPFPDTSADPGIPGFYAALARKVPMGRTGYPEEVAGPVVFLLSDSASFINGVNLPVDGGWTAW